MIKSQLANDIYKFLRIIFKFKNVFRNNKQKFFSHKHEARLLARQ